MDFRAYFLLFLAFLSHLNATPLDDYVNAPDDHYRWTLQDKISTIDADTFYIHLTSQQWRTAEEVDKTLWNHLLTVVIPKKLSSRTAILTIGGGNAGEAPSAHASLVPCLDLALSNNTIACELSLIPNQHLKFSDEKDPRYIDKGRREDALVAYTWDKFLTTSDPTWPLRLPMTKAIVRGMDTLEELLQQHYAGLKLDGFILVGASKRGWAAWTTAAVDRRVKAIVPLVIDLLHLKQSYERHFSAYGNWSPAVSDYADMHIAERWESAAFQNLMQMIEPSSYLDRLTMPKYIINAAGDEFFLPDTSRLYFKSLPGEKHLLYLPNIGHHIHPDIYKETLCAYIQFFLSGTPLPTAAWEIHPGNLLTVTPSLKPSQVNLWQAHNPKGRDFRIHTIGKEWKSTPLAAESDGTFKAVLNAPENGWSAAFIEMKFQAPSGHNFLISTDVIVLPDQFPYSTNSLPSESL